MVANLVSCLLIFLVQLIDTLTAVFTIIALRLLFTYYDHFGYCVMCRRGRWYGISRFIHAIEGNEEKLVKEIDVEHGLWTELMSREVLTAAQLARCRSQVCNLLVLVF